MKRRLCICFSFTVLTSCAEPTASISRADSEAAIITTKTNYALGETVSAQLFNRSDRQLGYGACAVSLEKRYEGNKWLHVWPTSGGCIAILYVLDANSSRMLNTRLDSKLSSGVYRLRIQVSRESDRSVHSVYSPTFYVRDAA